MYNRSIFTPVLLIAALTLAACSKDEPTTSPGQAPPARVTKTKAATPAPKDQSNTVQAGTSETIHSLAPMNTVFWLEIKSFNALTVAFQEAVGDSLKGMTGPADPESALALMQLMGLPTEKLQMDQPLAVALSLDLGSKEPSYTLLLPMSSAQNTAKKIQEATKGSGMKVVAKGHYIAISNSSSYRPDLAQAESLGGVRGQGLLGMHVQTARLVDRFEKELDQGLEAMLAQASMGARSNQAKKAGSAALVETLNTLSKGLKDVSFRIDLIDGQLTLESSATLRAGSRLTKFGRDDASNLRAMLSYAQSNSDELVLGTAHKSALRFLGDPLVAMYDKHAVSMETQGVSKEYERLLAMVVGESVDVAFTGSLAEYKTDLALFMNGVDSGQWVAMAERFVESNLIDFQDLTLMQPRKGQDEDSRFAQYDLVAQANSKMAQELERLLGSPRIRLRLLGHGSETMVTMGEGGHFQDRSEEKSPALPGDLTWALDRVQGANPAFVSHMHAQHGYLDELLQKLILGTDAEPATAPLNAKPTWVTSYVAFGSTEWRMGARLDLETLRQQMDQAAQLQSAAFARPR